MNIQPGDRVRLRSAQNQGPFSFSPGEDTWLQVGRKTERGWYASPAAPRNPLIMTIMDITYLFQESDVIEHKPGPWWVRFLHVLIDGGSRKE